MRVALISFEFPPQTAYGGIGSYMHEVSLMLTDAGHYVEVFCAGITPSQAVIRENLVVNTVGDMDKDTFAKSLMPVFAKRHRQKAFEVIESVDFHSDARLMPQEFPEIPLVIKLHTPSFLTSDLNSIKINLMDRIRFAAGALRRGRFAWLRENHDVLNMRNDRESELYRVADIVVSPSRDLIPIVERRWGARPDGIGLLPNPYSPAKDILMIDPKGPSEPILYLGRLEMRKGVPDLVKALVILEKSGSPVSARFVGFPFPSPKIGLTMEQWAKTKLDMSSGRYSFLGPIDRSEVGSEFTRSGLAVFPARWENFPYTCLEAMAAGRVVVGSAAGGMRDMITDGVNGFLIRPNSPRELADKILNILRNPSRFNKVGCAARERVLSAYSHKSILPRQIETYQKAIEKKRGQ